MNESILHQPITDQDTLEIYSIAYGINDPYETTMNYENEFACANEYNINTLQDIQNSIIL
jgi:hypothetical protein